MIPMDHLANLSPFTRRLAFSHALTRLSTLSSFRGGTAANAFCSVQYLASREPFATRSIIVGIDSYSDITVAHRDIVYNIRPIDETVQMGAGEALYKVSNLVKIPGASVMMVTDDGEQFAVPTYEVDDEDGVAPWNEEEQDREDKLLFDKLEKDITKDDWEVGKVSSKLNNLLPGNGTL